MFPVNKYLSRNARDGEKIVRHYCGSIIVGEVVVVIILL